MESIIEPFAVTDDSLHTPSHVRGEDAVTYLHLGNAYAQQGCYEQALEAFQLAISLQPDSAQAYLGLGGVYFVMRCRQEAANAFQQAACLQPDLMEAHYGYGLCSSLMGRSDEAISALEQARMLISAQIVESSSPPSIPPAPDQPNRSLFSRLRKLSLPRHTPKSSEPDPITLHTVDPPVPGPITQKSSHSGDRTRNTRSGDAMLLTGFLTVLGTGTFLSAPYLQGEPNSSAPKIQAAAQRQEATQPKQSISSPASALPAGRLESANQEALIHAVESGDLENARTQLDKNVSANTRRTDGTPLLIYATDRGDLPMVDAFLEHNADPNTEDPHHGTPLMYASLNNDLATVKLLVKHGANVNAHAINHDTALTLAAALGKVDMVKELLDQGADPGQKGENGKTAMQTARELGQQDIVALLKNYASKNRRNRSLLFAR